MEAAWFSDRATTDPKDGMLFIRDVQLGTAAKPPYQDPTVRAPANEVSVLPEAAMSVTRDSAHQLAGIDPTGVIPSHLRNGRQRMESPFLPLAPVGFGHSPEERTEMCNVGAGRAAVAPSIPAAPSESSTTTGGFSGSD